MTAIRIENLSKSFGWLKKVEAVKNLSLEVETGQVYGLLGWNGAGKTTTIRMILDLVRPDEGDVFIFDKHVHREHSILNKVGAQVEGANFYNFLSGRRNLKVLALTGNMDNPEPHIDELLELVGMTERSRRRVKGYSTGMKQRLGLAAALLNNPKLVILDEPTNGLDPQGIQEIRFFIRELADKHGKTVLLSSHMLGEVEQICDRVAIINKGVLIREGAVRELLSDQTRLQIEAEPLDTALQTLSPHWTCRKNTRSLTVDASREDTPQVISKLVENHIHIFEVTRQRQTLEDFFLSVTGAEDNEDLS
ncbi:MAG: ABC transporter ATP-binding protein [Anaerolineae bacterium]|nr:ABC transporter ATP-binding protein [Anaerolineae bacterium]